MLESSRIAVVVPAHNEARWIAETVRSIPSYVDSIVVIDDRSSDDTGAIARASGDERVVVVQHSENRGVGAAIVTGYRRALAAGADVIAVMAGDGQMDPGDLYAVVMPIVRREADYVKGDRLRHPDARTMPRLRRVGTRALAWITRHAAGLDRLSDSQCGYTAISADAVRALELDSLWPRYGYCNELLGRIAARGLRLAEVVVRPVYRGEASGLRPWHALDFAAILLRVAAMRLRHDTEGFPLWSK